jgi:chromatin segregation and condensation protein Rec8/ScpA/Scc1 (kleisin family)
LDDKFNLIDKAALSDFSEELINTKTFLAPTKCVDTTIRDFLHSTTERKMRGHGYDSSANVMNHQDSEMQLRNHGDIMKYPGSSNEPPKDIQDLLRSDERYADLENMINNGPDVHDDYMNYEFNQNQDVKLSDYEMVEERPCYKSYNIKDYETTQGTFHCKYMNSYNEISSIITQTSKNKNILLSELDAGKAQGFRFSELIKKFKASNITKHDKVEVFMNLLHMQREGKLKLQQDRPEEFSDILIINN